MRMKAGSLQPPMTIELLEDGHPITGLNTATTKRLVAEQDGVTVITDTNPTVDNTAGTLSHGWSGAETATVGRMFWKAEVDFGDGLVIFPPYGEEVTDIE
jgi:hypothetical protein